jgi:hypothetical protein
VSAAEAAPTSQLRRTTFPPSSAATSTAAADQLAAAFLSIGCGADKRLKGRLDLPATGPRLQTAKNAPQYD